VNHILPRLPLCKRIIFKIVTINYIQPFPPANHCIWQSWFSFILLPIRSEMRPSPYSDDAFKIVQPHAMTWHAGKKVQSYESKALCTWALNMWALHPHDWTFFLRVHCLGLQVLDPTGIYILHVCMIKNVLTYRTLNLQSTRSHSDLLLCRVQSRTTLVLHHSIRKQNCDRVFIWG